MTSASAARQHQIDVDTGMAPNAADLGRVVLLRRPQPSGRPFVRRLELVGGGTHLSRVQDSPADLAPRSRRLPIRALDIVGATVGLALLWPVLLVVWLAIRLTSPGPALFRQVRVGRDGVPFTCLKFRSMHHDAAERLDLLLEHPSVRSEWSANQKLRFDPRVTSVGRVIRRFDLDELPQLWNVLRGEMSLVGPRPVLIDEAERYGNRLSVVLTVKPGMTGLWQVSGRNELSYDQRVEIDTCYVAVQSLGVDLALIARTVWLILTRQNGAL
jgi:exopolysaccharide production protein ExoY